MARKVKIIRRADIEKKYERTLELELDYELASLFSAMNEKNEVDIEKSKKRLSQISMELESMKA